ncbi:hypothetical protein B6N60_03517 [Richelia sinica FACHB-800]|uniref:3'-phosphate/5'-hydroxy nucleic acid ligase n=1 Tax=Richelia sinica FACHB-800 TaxID=1357546 RepID=A0A975Y617_9NOST|nr:hypothetical protein B6N60_03517 [Richelia sinica FACHB-800]
MIALYYLADVEFTSESSITRKIQLQGVDYVSLLVAWLNELLYLHESENLAFNQFTILHLDAHSLEAEVNGAGRVMSRHKAKREIKGDRLKDELELEGISIRAGSMSGLAEEAPQAYKDVSRVVNVVSQARIARKVARLHPVAVVKG